MFSKKTASLIVIISSCLSVGITVSANDSYSKDFRGNSKKHLSFSETINQTESNSKEIEVTNNKSKKPSFIAVLKSPQEMVDRVWQDVNDRYIDSRFNGVDWQEVRKDYSSRDYENFPTAYTAINEMLALLGDSLTKFMTPNEFETLKLNLNENQIAMGLNLVKDTATQKIKVDFTNFGSPAFAAGINHGDSIAKIDGQNTEGMNVSQVLSLLQEKSGKMVKLAIERNGREIDLEIARGIVKIPPVRFQLQEIDNHKIAHIHVSQFNENTESDMRQAIEAAESQNVEGYVFDLRWNPGGLFDSAINIARMWINQGTIVTTVNRQGIVDRQSAENRALTDKPLVVIVNHDSISGSEIVASALQQNNRATVIGDKTRGRGSIQSLEVYPGDYSLLLTIGMFLAPNGNIIQDQGVQPNLKVEPTESEIIKLKSNPTILATEEDLMWVKAVEVLEQKL